MSCTGLQSLTMFYNPLRSFSVFCGSFWMCGGVGMDGFGDLCRSPSTLASARRPLGRSVADGLVGTNLNQRVTRMV